MKLTVGLLFLSATLSLAQEPANEAQELFAKMEAKIAAAKTLHVLATSREPREKGDRHDATLQLDGEKARLDFDWWAAAKGEVKWSCISDGAKSWSTQAKDAPKDAPKGLSKALLVGFARTGTWALNEAGTAMSSGGDAGDGSRWVVSAFKMGKKVQEGKQSLQAVEYAVNAGKPDAMTFTVWIDVKTFLPAKRDVDIGGWKLAETYRITLDGKMDPRSFQK